MLVQSMFNQKSILVTGGTGSFGRTFVYHLLTHYDAERIVIFSRDEQKQQEMANRFGSTALQFMIGDVRDVNRLNEACRGIDYIVHAAAMKIVTTAEYNPLECIKTNIHGAENVITAAIANRVSQIIALSTDKAAVPINLYGASKLASDKLFIAANNISRDHASLFSVVRYGNVVASRGSVLPYFYELLKSGSETLPITDERMTRFWITLEEGIQFVVNAFKRQQAGEVFIPKLPSVRIVDLARSLKPDIELKIIGIRPGEKIHEVMIPKDESHMTLEFADHYVIKPAILLPNAIDYSKNPINETGNPVSAEFEYHSGNNPNYLSIEQLRELNKKLGFN